MTVKNMKTEWVIVTECAQGGGYQERPLAQQESVRVVASRVRKVKSLFYSCYQPEWHRCEDWQYGLQDTHCKVS